MISPEPSSHQKSAVRARFALGLVFLALVLPEASAQPLRPRILRLDMFDLDGAGRMNQRHLRLSRQQTVLCCMDVAWLPWNPNEGSVQLGGGLNLGGWVQDMDVGPHLRVVDLLVEGSVRWVGSSVPWTPWARLDLGPAVLVVERRQVGMDWGVGGAFQAGIAFAGPSADILVGAGVDIRRYANLHVTDLPAMTVSVGAGL